MTEWQHLLAHARVIISACPTLSILMARPARYVTVSVVIYSTLACMTARRFARNKIQDLIRTFMQTSSMWLGRPAVYWHRLDTTCQRFEAHSFNLECAVIGLKHAFISCAVCLLDSYAPLRHHCHYQYPPVDLNARQSHHPQPHPLYLPRWPLSPDHCPFASHACRIVDGLY